LLTNPTACTPAGVGLETRIVATSWEGDSDTASFVSHDVAPNESQPLGPTGCDVLAFDPSFSAVPSTTAPDAPTGLDVSLSFANDGLVNPEGVSSSALKDATVTLPEGMTINPASAGGLSACTDAELGLDSDDPLACPPSSKVGTVTATTPLIDDVLEGGVYVRSQASGDPESGEMFRIALVLENEDRGLSIRLPGSIRADADTGRLVTTFANNPQLPVEQIDLSFKGGQRAPLATPPTCGTKTIDAELTSWSGKTVNQQSTFDIACTPGLGGFAPSMSAGSTNPIAGGFSPFALNVAKPDRDAALNGLSMELPEGLLGSLKGNVGSQVGTVTAFAGPGSNPFALPGQVYLEGPYGDAPFSLRAVVPAKAGPFDLGEVVVRQKIYTDPVDAHVTVVSDPIPTIVKGVPARLQRLDVNVDKPGFIVNPTSCAVKEVKATLGSAAGQSVPLTNRFQVGECAALGFTPKLAMRLTGKGKTRTGAHPGLSTVLTQARGQANIGRAQVILPKSVVLDATNSADPKLLCGYDQGLKADCPASSIIGKATANTPLLDKPLTGNVHLVQGIKFGKTGNRIRTTPSLLVKLRGEVTIDLRAQTDSKRGRLITTFPEVPDAPVSKFSLSINGGEKGILVITRTKKAKINVCNTKQIAQVETDGQNGKRADYNTTVKAPCAKQAKKTGKAKR
jgi:hypothetical protein